MFPLKVLRQLSPVKKSRSSPTPPPPCRTNSQGSSSSKSSSPSRSRPRLAAELPIDLSYFFSLVQFHIPTRPNTALFKFHSPSDAQADAAVLAFSSSLLDSEVRYSLRKWTPLTDIGEGKDGGSVRRKIGLVADSIEMCVKEGQMYLRSKGDGKKDIKKAIKIGDDVLDVLRDLRRDLRERCGRSREGSSDKSSPRSVSKDRMRSGKAVVAY